MLLAQGIAITLGNSRIRNGKAKTVDVFPTTVQSRACAMWYREVTDSGNS